MGQKGGAIKHIQGGCFKRTLHSSVSEHACCRAVSLSSEKVPVKMMSVGGLYISAKLRGFLVSPNTSGVGLELPSASPSAPSVRKSQNACAAMGLVSEGMLQTRAASSEDGAV